MAIDVFFQRWSQRKHNAEKAVLDDIDSPKTNEDHGISSPPPQTFEEVVQLNESNFVSKLFLEGVSSEVKKTALRKLFHTEEYNILDGMNDYDLDYSKAEPLNIDVMTPLRKWVEPDIELTSNNECSEVMDVKDDVTEDQNSTTDPEPQKDNLA